jgi:FtsZ-binding cell division protein ZapB
MTSENLLDDLEKRIDKAIEKIAMLRKLLHKLESEKNELQSVLTDREIRIQGLQNQLDDLLNRPADYEVEQYKANQKLLKIRIRTLLSKLDELKMLD